MQSYIDGQLAWWSRARATTPSCRRFALSGVQDGRRYEGTPGQLDYRIRCRSSVTGCGSIRSPRARKETGVRQAPVAELLPITTPPARAELLWRLVCAALRADSRRHGIPLSFVNTRRAAPTDWLGRPVAVLRLQNTIVAVGRPGGAGQAQPMGRWRVFTPADAVRRAALFYLRTRQHAPRWRQS